MTAAWATAPVRIARSYNPIEGGPAIWLDRPISSFREPAELARRLREYPAGDGPIDIVIDGEGGSCARGLEMYTLLREHPRRKRVTILSAPSMSGVIAMAGDTIRIVRSGWIFLHHARCRQEIVADPINGYLPAAMLERVARDIRQTDALHVAIFARRTGLLEETIRDLREREATLDAYEAVRLGFADEVTTL